MRIFTYGFWLLIVLIGVSFAAMNSKYVAIRYYIGETDIYLPLLLLLLLALGVLIGLLALFPKYLRLKSLERKSRQRVKRLESDIKSLKQSTEEVDT